VLRFFLYKIYLNKIFVLKRKGAEMTVVITHFNTWAACLYHTLRTDYYEYICAQAQISDIMHLSEVHSCTDPDIPEFLTPEDAGHREGPLHVKQLQMLHRLLDETHHIYFTPHMRGLHDLDASHQTVEYGIVTLVKRGAQHEIMDDMIYRGFNCLNEQHAGGKPAGKSAHSVMAFDGDMWHQSVHTHGHWDMRSKIDTPGRYEQFTKLMSLGLRHRQSETSHDWTNATLTVGGDFNITSQCAVLEHIRKSTQFGEGGGVILSHVYSPNGIPLKTRTKWYPEDKKYREANFVIVDSLESVISYRQDPYAPSDHMLIETVRQ